MKHLITDTIRGEDQHSGATLKSAVFSSEGKESPGVEGHRPADTHADDAFALGGYEPLRDEGQTRHDTQAMPAVTLEGEESASDGGHHTTDTQRAGAPALAETIAAIRAAHRERCFWMEQRKRADLSLGSYLRTALGWTLSKPVTRRNAIKSKAAEIMKAGEEYVKATRKMARDTERRKNLVVMPEMAESLRQYAHIVVPQIEMRGRTDELEAAATRAMTNLAKQLPVAAWIDSIHGVGPKGLAIIIGEAGDLGNYANPGKLWKRMGVAVIDGKRQGGLTKTAAKADWEVHGYNRVRRSRLYTIGDAMLKHVKCPYRQIYLDRKAYESARAEADGLIVAPAVKIPKAKQAEYRSLGHIDNRARRYVEKRLLKDLWRAWRAGVNTR